MLTASRNLALAGIALHGLAWAKFAGDAVDVEESNRTGPLSVSVLPLGVGPSGALQPGTFISLRF